MKNAKAVFLILSLACLVLLITTMKFYLGEKDERSKREFSQADFAKASQEIDRLNTTLEVMKKTKIDLEARIKNSETNIQDLNNGIEEERKRGAELITRVGLKEREAEGLKNKLNAELKHKEELEKSLESVSKELNNKKSYIDKLEIAKEEAEKKVVELKNKAEKPTKDKDIISLGTVVIKK